VRSELGAPSLQREVAALRCGLDYDGTWGALVSRCQELLKTSYTEADHADGKSLPFDRDRAYALYKALFGQIEDVIKEKQLLIVPSGALTQLPFQVLITEKPDPAVSGDNAFRRAAWLSGPQGSTKSDDHLGVLLDAAGIAQVRKLGVVVVAVIRAAVELMKGEDGYVLVLGETRERPR
jgi:hypothetical protein